MSVEPSERGDATRPSTSEELPPGCGPRWNEENKAAIDDYNARVASEGLPLARYRSFAREL